MPEQHGWPFFSPARYACMSLEIDLALSCGVHEAIVKGKEEGRSPLSQLDGSLGDSKSLELLEPYGDSCKSGAELTQLLDFVRSAGVSMILLLRR